MSLWDKFNKVTNFLMDAADNAAAKGMDSNNLDTAANSYAMAEKLIERFDRWLDQASIDELRQGLSDGKYRIRSDSDNDYRRQREIEDKIRKLEPEERRRKQEEAANKKMLEEKETQRKQAQYINDFEQYLNDAEKNILDSYRLYCDFKRNASLYNDVQHDLLKKRYGAAVNYILSEQFLEDDDADFGAKNLMWLINKRKPAAGSSIIALLLAGFTYDSLIEERIELAKKEASASLLENYLNKVEKLIVSSQNMFLNFDEFYDSFPEEYRSEFLKRYSKKLENTFSIDFLKGDIPGEILKQLNNKSTKAGKNVIELLLSKKSHEHLVIDNIQNASSMREEAEWTEIKGAFDKLLADIEAAIKANTPSTDKAFPKIEDEVAEKREQVWVNLRDKINGLLAEIESTVKENTPIEEITKANQTGDSTTDSTMDSFTSNVQAPQQTNIEKRKRTARSQTYIAAGEYHSVGLKNDGTVVVTGSNIDPWRNRIGQCDTEDWRDIIAVSARGYHTVGLKADGSVVAVGRNDDGKCDTQEWRDIVAISAGGNHTVGLKKNGTVVATGSNKNLSQKDSNQCGVEDWRDIVAVSAGSYHTLGVKADGTVVAVGDNEYGQCDTQEWRNIIAVAAGGYHSVGLKEDGTVIAVGRNKGSGMAVRKSTGQCNTQGWRNIIAVSAFGFHTAGLTADGKVLTLGDNEYGEGNTQGWQDIVAVSVGDAHTIGLKSNGTVVAVGSSSASGGKCDTKSWTGIGLASEKAAL